MNRARHRSFALCLLAGAPLLALAACAPAGAAPDDAEIGSADGALAQTTDGQIVYPTGYGQSAPPPAACTSSDASTTTESVALWRGFRHSWGYNHRINRLGDIVTNLNATTASESPRDYELTHGAASGTGPDTATFTSYYTELAAEHIVTKTGTRTLHFSGTEGTARTATATYTFTSIPAVDGYVVVLNGFDMRTSQDADKLQRFSLQVGATTYDAGAQTLTATVTGTLDMGCDSPECQGGDTGFDYDMDVAVALIAGDTAWLRAKTTTVSRSYSWEGHTAVSGTELADADAMVSSSIVGQPGYERAALGFQKISLSLNRDHHMVGWRTQILPQSYDAATGTSSFDVYGVFRQWRDGMWDACHAAQVTDCAGETFPDLCAAGQTALYCDTTFSVDYSNTNGWGFESGSATFDARVVQIQVKDAVAFHNGSRSGSIWWAADGTGVSDGELAASQDLAMEEFCY